jgi:hypothetical protein
MYMFVYSCDTVAMMIDFLSIQFVVVVYRTGELFSVSVHHFVVPFTSSCGKRLANVSIHVMAPVQSDAKSLTSIIGNP